MEDVSDECFFLFLNLSVAPSRENTRTNWRSNSYVILTSLLSGFCLENEENPRRTLALGITISVSYLL